MANYFNSLSFREKLHQIGQCRFMKKEEFHNGVSLLKNKKIVILGCGAQGLNQGLNMRDSGLDIAFALRDTSILDKNSSWQRATQQNFTVGTFEQLIPSADLVLNLTPDKQHNEVINTIQPLMKRGATLGYSHGFNIVEEGQQIRSDLTVVMVAPKCPGTEVREEYKRGFGVPTLIAVHQENDPENKGWDIAKAWVVATGGDRAGVLASSFVAEVKSDLMGEQTILCGLLQTGTLFCYDYLLAQGKDAADSAKLLQYGWETITEALKQGGVTLMMDKLSNPAKLRAFELAEQIKQLLTPLFYQHMDDIISGKFSEEMIQDWHNNDQNLLKWREETRHSAFELAGMSAKKISEQEYFEQGVLMVAFIKAGVELTFDTMLEVGILPESSYYESLHELPLIANTIARKRLYEMNVVISDTAEYGNYLFSNSALVILQQHLSPLLKQGDLAGDLSHQTVSNQELLQVNQMIRQHPIEATGLLLRGYMTAMKCIDVAAK